MRAIFRLRVAILASAAVAALTPATAQVAEPLDYASMTREELQAETNLSINRVERDICQDDVPLWAYLETLQPDDFGTKVLSTSMQLGCLSERGEYEEFFEVLDQSGVGQVGLLNNMGLGIAIYLGNSEETLRRLRHALLQSDEVFDDAQMFEAFASAIRVIRTSGLDAELSETASDTYYAGRLGSINPEYSAVLAYYAMEKIAEQDRGELAGLLQYMSNPSDFLTLLTLRKYEDIWPELEARVGPAMANIAPQYLEERYAAIEENPSTHNLRALTEALRKYGLLEDSVTVLQEWRERPDTPKEIDDQLGWAMNEVAHSLGGLDRLDESFAIFDELADLDPIKVPNAVSFTLNRLGSLVYHEQWDAALSALEHAEQSNVAGRSSNYGKMVLGSAKVCAYFGLENEQEAQKALKWVEENAEYSYRLAAKALVCAGDRDKAIALLLKQMDDEVDQVTLNRDVQPNLYQEDVAVEDRHAILELVQDVPELREKFETYARLLPDEFRQPAPLAAEE